VITAWGDRQIGVWEATTTEADFSPLIVYQFTYMLPEKPWWWPYIEWLPFISPWAGWGADPRWLRDGVVKAIALKTEIPEDEIKVLWFVYNSDTNAFQIQIKWIPPTAGVGAIPAALPALPLIAVIIAALSTAVSLFFLLRIVEIAPDTVEKLVEEARKGISWITILAGIVVTGSLVPIFFAKSKRG